MENKIEELSKKPESKIVSSSTFDERRKILTHRSTEESSNDLGDLKITTIAEIHEKGIKKTLKDYEERRKIYVNNIELIKDLLADAPKMTPELEELEKKIQKLNLINRKKNETEATRKKDQQALEMNQKDLKLVEKDIKEIKDAIGSRMKL